ncbi:adenosylcobinamide-GDP ribazoletransferase [Proteinivorax tanatarense]|uniref:Adenosylcobinamide-GDP ribazoletransferase n=1 Tax=Proteinivorax tanatarense TaxID=1260629 RepID=A0AAU7VJQ3_9FIRM
MKKLIIMLQFLTRIPINLELKVENQDFSKGVIYFPLVGLIIGAINGLVFVMSSIIFEGLIPLIFVLLSNTLITGGLHLDGVADTSDAIYSARKKERMLEIMKDSRVGTNGVLALFFVLFFKLAFYDAIDSSILLPIIMVTPMIGRTSIGVTLYKGKCARKGESLGSLFVGKTTFAQTAVMIFYSSIICFIFLEYAGLFSFIFSLFLALILKVYFSNKIGGLSGDILGAVNEVVELFFLAIFLMFGILGGL